jgi:hypothetical protein
VFIMGVLGPSFAFPEGFDVFGLKRYYRKGHLHLVTFGCYRRLLRLKTALARDIFSEELGTLRDAMVLI